MAVAGKVSGIYRKNGNSTAFSNLVLSDIGTHKVYRVPIADTAHRYWDPNQAVVVEVDPTGSGTFAAPTGEYEIQRPSGYVVFKEALGASAVVRASGYCFSITQIGGAFGWSVDAKIDLLDATTFESDEWKEFVASFKSYSAKVEKFWVNETEHNLFGSELLFVFYVSTGTDQTRFEGWGCFTSESVNVNVGELIKAPLDIQGIGCIYFRRDA